MKLLPSSKNNNLVPKLKYITQFIRITNLFHEIIANRQTKVQYHYESINKYLVAASKLTLTEILRVADPSETRGSRAGTAIVTEALSFSISIACAVIATFGLSTRY
jgi:hypothetical protein